MLIIFNILIYNVPLFVSITFVHLLVFLCCIVREFLCFMLNCLMFLSINHFKNKTKGNYTIAYLNRLQQFGA